MVRDGYDELGLVVIGPLSLSEAIFGAARLRKMVSRARHEYKWKKWFYHVWFSPAFGLMRVGPGTLGRSCLHVEPYNKQYTPLCLFLEPKASPFGPSEPIPNLVAYYTPCHPKHTSMHPLFFFSVFFISFFKLLVLFF